MTQQGFTRTVAACTVALNTVAAVQESTHDEECCDEGRSEPDEGVPIGVPHGWVRCDFCQKPLPGVWVEGGGSGTPPTDSALRAITQASAPVRAKSAELLGRDRPTITDCGGQRSRWVLIDGYKRVRALKRLARDTVRATHWQIEKPRR